MLGTVMPAHKLEHWRAWKRAVLASLSQNKQANKQKNVQGLKAFNHDCCILIIKKNRIKSLRLALNIIMKKLELEDPGAQGANE